MIVAKRPPNWEPFRKASGFGGVIRGRVGTGPACAALALVEPVAVAVHFQDMDVVGMRGGIHRHFRTGNGTTESPTPGEVHDAAVEAAETDATTRALVTFGSSFGLSSL